MTKLLKVLLPVVLILAGVIGAGAMLLARKEPATRAVAPTVPLVRVQLIELGDVELSVRSQGTVTPRTESVLVAEVAGRVIEVHPAFVAGGFFRSDDVLLQVDPHDHRRALVQARAAVAQTELRLSQERAEADVARSEWRELGGGDATPLTLREPHVAEAEAALAAARAAVEQAERNLERTRIRAPYAGRVRDKRVDLGQYVTAGTPLGTIYAVDFAEVRLPLPDSELAFVDLPLMYREADGSQPGPEVILRSRFAGRVFEWRGRIVRTEGEIDPRTRMVHTVARVEDPYGRAKGSDRPPLAPGMFVEAEILGRRLSRVAVIPRTVIRGTDVVLVVDPESRLRFRTVRVLRNEQDRAIVGEGLHDGDRLCLSNLAAVADGMPVRVAEDGPGTEQAPR